MKQAQIFQQYIWIINTLRAHRRMTFEEIARKWQDDCVTDGNKLHRSAFNRHRDAILDMFGIIIDCEERTYKYYISNPEELCSDSIGGWMFSTLAVHGVLADSAAVKDRVVLEEVPAGEEFLHTIIHAIKSNRKVLMRYQRFGAEEQQRTVEPYAIKLFQRRWYMLAFTGRHYATYALDRMLSVDTTDDEFKMPPCFSPQAYFEEYFGVLTDETPMQHVVLRAHGWTPNYLRTLPLHHSQRQLESGTSASGRNYTDFSLDIRPTADFLGQLLFYGDGIEVLSPQPLREQMRQKIVDSLKNY